MDVLRGAFGVATPALDSSRETSPAGFYHWHLGDVFTAGSPNWALDPSHDTPLNTIWGHGVMCAANAFRPLQLPQVIVTPAPRIDALRGVIVGGIEPETLEGT